MPNLGSGGQIGASGRFFSETLTAYSALSNGMLPMAVARNLGSKLMGEGDAFDHLNPDPSD